MKPVALVALFVFLLSAWAAEAVDVPATYGDAMRWYKRAAEAGSPNAQFLLGRMYETGQNRKRDFAAAATWYRKAAEHGHRLAQYRLGQMHFAGTGIAQSYTEAANWFEKAAGQKLREAQHDIGYLYDRGFGVAQSPLVAAGWYRKAAEQGLGRAQYNLGVLLAGDSRAGGVTADIVEAWMWLSLARRNGVADAEKTRAEIEKKMSETELGQAKKRLAARAVSGERGR